MKKNIVLMLAILLLVISPFLGSEALANFLGTSAMEVKSYVDPVYVFLFGIGVTFVGTRA